MPIRMGVALALIALVIGPVPAGGMKRQLAALPARATVSEDFNRCAGRRNRAVEACCQDAWQACRAECERAHARCAEDHDERVACRSACAEAARWCQRGVGSH